MMLINNSLLLSFRPPRVQRQPDQHIGRFRGLSSTAGALSEKEQHPGYFRVGVLASECFLHIQSIEP